MQTEHLINYTAQQIDDLHKQAIITQAQYEAYDFIFAALHPSQPPYFFGSLPADAVHEMWIMFHLLPENIRKVVHQAIIR